MYAIIGLGNPGKEYETTRHNIGFLAVEEVAKRLNISELREKGKLQAFAAEGQFEGHRIILGQPATFMNNSGLAVSAVINWHKIPPDHLIVIYDDVDLEPGQVRVREGGGAGGHHGMESIIAHLGTSDFSRIRIGIGRETASGDVSKYVLDKFRPEEREKMAGAVARAAEAALTIVARGVSNAMTHFNA